jgi:hypothetical protein
MSTAEFRKEFLSATNSLFRPLARNLTPSPPRSFCHPRCRGKKVSLQTFFGNPPGQEAYHALKISRIYPPPKFCYTQSPSRHSCSFGDVLYRIPIFYFRFVRGLGPFGGHFDLLRLSTIDRVLSEGHRLFSTLMTIGKRNLHNWAKIVNLHIAG